MGAGSYNMTTTTGTKFIPAVWSKEIKRATESKLVMKELVKRFDADVSQKGSVVHIPNLSNLTASDKDANTAVSLSYPTETEDTITIDQHKHVAFLIEDILKAQADYDLRKEYTAKAGYAVAKVIDSKLMTLGATFTQTVGSAGADIDDTALLRSVQYLDDADADAEDRYAVVCPAQKAAIFKIDKFVRADWAPFNSEKSSPIITGKIAGDIYGVRFYVSTNVGTTAGTPTCNNNLMWQKEALALAIQKSPRTQGDYMLEYLGWLIVCDVLYGAAVYRDTFGVLIKG